MVQLALFINLFFVPLLPLYVLQREKKEPLKPNLELLFQYGIVAACNVPLTKVFIVLIRILSGIYISMDSSYYTVAALLSSGFMILLYKFFRTYPIHKYLKKNYSKKE